MTVARHTLYNLAGAVVPVVISLATVPLYLSVIGLERYGVLSICWLLLGYFGLFDLGLGKAASQKIASLADGEAAQRSAVFWGALLLSLAIACAAILIFIPAAGFAFEAMRFESEPLQGEAMAAVPWLALALPLGVVNGVLAGALTGRERFLALNLVTTASTAASSLAPLLTAILIGPELKWLIIASLAVRALSLLALALLCKGAVPLRAPRLMEKEQARALLRFGGWTTLSNVVAPLLVYWDRFAIGALIGAAAVSVYVVPFNVVMYLLVLPGALAASLFPRMSRSPLSSDDVLSRGTELIAGVMAVTVLATLIAIGPFFHVWIGPELARQSGPVAGLLLIGLWAVSIAQVPAANLQARGRPKAIALIHLAETGPYILIMAAAISSAGLIGAALSWTLRCMVDCVVMVRLAGVRFERPERLAIQFVLVVAGGTVASLMPLWSTWRFGSLLVLLAVSAAIVWRSHPDLIPALLRSIGLRPAASDAR